MNYFHTSSGERVSKQRIDRNVRNAKQMRLIEQAEMYGYNFCSVCLRNDCKPLDCAHTESVDSCQKNGYVEKAWDLKNIEIVGRNCHQVQDKLNIMSSKTA